MGLLTRVGQTCSTSAAQRRLFPRDLRTTSRSHTVTRASGLASAIRHNHAYRRRGQRENVDRIL
jgi:hypothetical protein